MIYKYADKKERKSSNNTSGCQSAIHALTLLVPGSSIVLLASRALSTRSAIALLVQFFEHVIVIRILAPDGSCWFEYDKKSMSFQNLPLYFF